MDSYNEIMKIAFQAEEALDEAVKAKFGRQFKDKQILIREGDIQQKIFWILEGEVYITRKMGDKYKVLATLGKGELIGEMSFFDKSVRSATVIAKGAVHALEFTQGELRRHLCREPHVDAPPVGVPFETHPPHGGEAGPFLMPRSDRHDLVGVVLLDVDMLVPARVVHGRGPRQIGLREEEQHVRHVVAAAEQRPSVPAILLVENRLARGSFSSSTSVCTRISLRRPPYHDFPR